MSIGESRYPLNPSFEGLFEKQSAYIREQTLTVRQNLEDKIRRCHEELSRLETIKAEMEKTGLLDLAIRHLEEAMRF